MAVYLHHPWLFVFGVLGNIVSIFLYISPLPMFVRICKVKSTMGYQVVPYVVALFSAMLWMYYAFLKKKNAFLLISINSFGCLIETIYISIFLAYASKEIKRQAIKLVVLLIGGMYTVIFVTTMFTFSGRLRTNVVGWICVAVSVCVFASPLTIMFQVVRTKSVEFMPFSLSLFLTLTAIVWFGYGMLLEDLCIALPNVVGFILGMVQMVVYGIYRNGRPVIDDDKMVVPPEHVIVNMVVPVAGENSENSEVNNGGDDGSKGFGVGEDNHDKRITSQSSEIAELITIKAIGGDNTSSYDGCSS
ncbi:unnamed protein product [Cuscuta epithymum]|uniref:Bidirectional sugar transporter SWEET n=1 Tax=Cuscuta epithymum TaxID=186058 RepID=A0AAV0F977_9ASTE|nr:unnamed protein product [Cuscuta epithymum]